MNILFIFIFILALVALIVVHELGHFFAAKCFGIRVDEFGIGFPPRLFAFRWGETEYSLNWLFFGGFVKIFGEHEEEGGDSKQSFTGRSRWVQAVVIIAGISMNVVLAWGAFSLGYFNGIPSEADPAYPGQVSDVRLEVLDVLPNSPAQKAGLMAGDVVELIQTGAAKLPTSANSASASDFIGAHQNESILITVLRDGSQKTFLARPAAGVIPGKPDKKALGIEFDDIGTLRLPLGQALIQGAALTGREISQTAVGLWQFFSEIILGRANLNNVAGPVGIAQEGASAASQGFSSLIFFVALISINLALINVLPIPGLDGGRLLFIVVEGISGRKISQRVGGYLTGGSIALLIVLMVIVTYHDIARLL